MEQKANYLGLQIFRQRNFRPEGEVHIYKTQYTLSKLANRPTELQKLGSHIGLLYIQLANFPTHYLVLVITDQDFRYALISAKVLPETMYTEMIMGDIGWLNVDRIHGDDLAITQGIGPAIPAAETALGDVGTSKTTSRLV